MKVYILISLCLWVSIFVHFLYDTNLNSKIVKYHIFLIVINRLNKLYIPNQKLANYGANGFYIRQPTKQTQNENSYKINQLHSHNINKRAFGDAITDILGGLQNKYDNWISNSGGAGDLVQRIPAKFSSAEHLIYDDYQIIGMFILLTF